jgi:hypothetical protein
VRVAARIGRRSEFNDASGIRRGTSGSPDEIADGRTGPRERIEAWSLHAPDHGGDAAPILNDSNADLRVAKDARISQALRDVAFELGRASAFCLNGADEWKSDLPIRVDAQPLLIGRRLRDDGHQGSRPGERPDSQRRAADEVRDANVDEIVRADPVLEIVALAEALSGE